MTPCVPDAGSPRQPLEYGTMPVVRIIMSTFNGARFLPELLNSISQQTGVTVRWWIRDDGSTDSTREILVDASSHMDMQVSAGANNRTVLSVLDLFQACAEDADLRHDVSGEGYTKLIAFVADRPGHDRGYVLDSRKLHASLDGRLTGYWVAGVFNQVTSMATSQAYEWMLLMDQDAVALVGLVWQLGRGANRWRGTRFPSVWRLSSTAGDPSRHRVRFHMLTQQWTPA